MMLMEPANGNVEMVKFVIYNDTKMNNGKQYRIFQKFRLIDY